MRIYLKNNNDSDNIENKIKNNYKQINDIKYKCIYSPYGIYRFKNNKLEKAIISYNVYDENIIDCFEKKYLNKILIDKEIISFKDTQYQMPLEHKILDVHDTIYNFSFNSVLVINKENNSISNMFLELKNDINNLDNIDNDIGSFISLLN